MNAYARAWEEYHRHGPPGWPWHEVVAEHFRHGAVVSTQDAFLMARRVDRWDDPAFILSPLQYREKGNAWMIWIAAGKLGALIRLLEAHPAEWVCYNRRGSMDLRWVHSSTFLRHGFPKSSEAPATACTADLLDRPGKGGCGSGTTPT